MNKEQSRMDEIKALSEFMEISTDVREIKRSLAVKMAKQGHKLAEIEQLLNVSPSFVSKWKKKYAQGGVEELKIGLRGSQGYLTVEEREEIIIWLRAKAYWHLAELEKHLTEKYEVNYKSKQSYYDLFHAAGISWKKKPEE
jgi:putative transposase